MIVTDENKNQYNIDKIISTGGQGAVFFVENNARIVIKVITNADGSIVKDSEKYEEYKSVVNGIMAKSFFNNLASPICMLEKPYCGYVMRFMEGMDDLESLMMPKGESISLFYNKTGGLKRRYFVLRELARILNDLYNYGLIYSDLSPKNVFISKNEKDHEVWLIDADNLHYSGEAGYSIGTPMYRAPEVFRGRDNSLQSDVYSFALLAFELLTLSKPFEGDYKESNEDDDWGDESEEANSFYTKVERGDIPSVLDEENNSQNSGIPLISVTTKEIRDLFYQTFESGRVVSTKRPSIASWLEALEHACNSIVKGSCGHYSISKECPLCGKKIQALRVDVFNIYHYWEDETIIEERKHAYSLRFDNIIEDKNIRELKLPYYIFNTDIYEKGKYPISIIKKSKGKDFEIESYMYDINITANKAKKIDNLNGMVFNLEKNGVLFRQIEVHLEEA